MLGPQTTHTANEQGAEKRRKSSKDQSTDLFLT